MPTYPKFDDPMTAFSRADGTTEAHHIDHGRIIGLHANVKSFGAKGDGVTDDHVAIQAAVDSGESTIYFPRGFYLLGNGNSITLSTHGQRLVGAAHTDATHNPIIVPQNAYAFITPTTGALSNISIENMNINLIGGSTSGGAIKARSNNFHSGWMIRDCTFIASGDGLSTDPLLWLSGYIGSYVDNCRIASGGGHGIFMDSSGFVCNLWQVTRCGVNACSLADRTHAGLYVGSGGSGFLVSGNDFESIRGKAIWVDGGAGIGGWINNNWFEDNWNTNVHASDTTQIIVANNSFQEPHNPQQAGFRHVLFQESLPTRRNHHAVNHNLFFGPNNGTPPDNVVLEIGTNVSYTYVEGNRGMGLGIGDGTGGNAKVIDSGNKTVWLPNDFDGIWRIPTNVAAYTPKLRIVANSTIETYTLNSYESPFSVANSGNTTFFRVHDTGHAEFTTAAAPAASGAAQNTKSFIPYIDTANNDALRIQRRLSGGSFITDYIAVDKGTDGVTFDTTAAASTPGSVVKKLPIYDKAGTLLGYIPIYSSIT